MDLDSISVHKHAEKELGQYAAILTSHLVNNPYVWLKQARLVSSLSHSTRASWLSKAKKYTANGCYHLMAEEEPIGMLRLTSGLPSCHIIIQLIILLTKCDDHTGKISVQLKLSDILLVSHLVPLVNKRFTDG